MKILHPLSSTFCLLALSALQPLIPLAFSQRSSYNLNLDWRLHVGDPAGADKKQFDDSAWKLVTLPRAWNEDDAFRADIREHSTGIAWYRKHFTLTATQLKDSKIFIEFEGARQAAEVYVNGRHIGRSENGVMAFGLDITPHAIAGANVISVRTDNNWDYREKSSNSRFQWADRNFNANYGGITKNVRLHITPKLHQTLPLYSNLGTTGVYIYATGFDIANRAATIHAESEVRNETGQPQTFTFTMEIPALGIKTAAAPVTLAPGKTTTVATAARATNIDFWSWGHGALYDVVTSLFVDGQPVDAVTTRTGFRKTEFANGVIKLNDRVIQMRGYAQRTSNEWPAIGASVPAWLSDFSNGLMVESGGNLVRWMHITPWKQDIESCDRVGLIQAMPAGDSEKDVTDRRWGQRVEVMRDAIIYNRNNPSILFYESGNAGISEKNMAEMKALRDKYDPHGGRAAGSRDMTESRIAEYGGHMLYIQKSARIPLWMMEYSRDEGLRKYWDDFSPPYHKDGDGPPHRDQPAPAYNRNQDSHAIENVIRWHEYWAHRPGTGRRVNSGGVNIIFSDSNTHHRGAENYRRSGEVDATRIPKDGFHAHQVMWDGWVDVENPRAHIIGHWNYAPGTVKNICVVSSADAVELFLNGKSLGRGAQSHRFLYTFENVAWQPGELRAVGYDTTGKKVAEAAHQTAGEPVALRLANLGKKSYFADGHDLALVEVEVIDAEGRRNPIALDMVDFALDGPAEWRGGIGHGRPDNFILSKQLPVECGVNRVFIRTTRTPGTITLRAKSGSLRPASLVLQSTGYPSVNGLAAIPPAPEIPRIDRGPTPSGPSYIITRIPVEIASARAGSNQGDAANSFDDGETTSWTSANKLGEAWIEYTLERPAALHEIVLKLAGWQRRSHPLRVTLDGREVFRGVAPRSLGYVTLPLQPAPAGRTVRIELLGGSEARDAYSLIEVANQANVSTGDERIGSTTLGIVEIEFYEKSTTGLAASNGAGAGDDLYSAVIPPTVAAMSQLAQQTAVIAASPDAAGPAGDVIGVTLASLTKNSRAWTPVMGEFHYSRHPAAEWRDSLLKMKAGGVDIVATYVFWIHHEEIEGRFDWSGDRDLRRFVQTCADAGLDVIVRLGPWDHGEVRNGGLPEWLVTSGWRMRSNDPRYMAKARILYGEIAAQIRGLLHKDGGPVIGAQVENEYRGPAEYLLSLKKMAVDAGIVVPLYTRTGWPALSTPMPPGEIVPLYGVYAEGFWDSSTKPMPGKYWTGFRFSTRRIDTNIASEVLGQADAADEPDAAAYPYLTCEIGGGMMSAYHRRILVDPLDIESTTLVKLGSGSVQLGYYMYHGGINPDAATPGLTLQESQSSLFTNSNDLPEKNYDFQAPLGVGGQVRPHYHLLRRLHLFMRDFGPLLAGMPVVLPEKLPGDKDDSRTLRWALRTNGSGGFLFVNNHQRLQQMPAHHGVRFALNLPPAGPIPPLASGARAAVAQAAGTRMVPVAPVDIAPGASFFWPINLDLGGGAILAHATAQPLCHDSAPDGGELTCFFAEIPGIEPEFAFNESTVRDVNNASGHQRKGDGLLRITNLKSGRAPAITLRSRDGRAINIVILSHADSLDLYKLAWAGGDSVFLSKHPITIDPADDTLRVHATTPGAVDVLVHHKPAPVAAGAANRPASARGALAFLGGIRAKEGIFTKITLPAAPGGARAEATAPRAEKLRDAASPARDIPRGRRVPAAPVDSDFAAAAAWKITLPAGIWKNATGPILRIHYTGDVARVLLDGKLILDDFYNGQPLDVPLARHAGKLDAGATLTVEILPLRNDSPILLPESARPRFGALAAVAGLDGVEIAQTHVRAFTPPRAR